MRSTERVTVAGDKLHSISQPMGFFNIEPTICNGHLPSPGRVGGMGRWGVGHRGQGSVEQNAKGGWGGGGGLIVYIHELAHRSLYKCLPLTAQALSLATIFL